MYLHFDIRINRINEKQTVFIGQVSYVYFYNNSPAMLR